MDDIDTKTGLGEANATTKARIKSNGPAQRADPRAHTGLPGCCTWSIIEARRKRSQGARNENCRHLRQQLRGRPGAQRRQK